MFREKKIKWNNSSLTQVLDQYQDKMWTIIYNYPLKGRWIVVDTYRDAKRRGIYPLLFTDPEGDSCFSIYQIRWIKKRFFNFFFWNFRETMQIFLSICKTVNIQGYSELPEPIKTRENSYPLIW